MQPATNTLHPHQLILTGVNKFQVKKRDGSQQAFDLKRIISAIQNAGNATQEFGDFVARRLTNLVALRLQSLFQEQVDVEEIQNIIEDILYDSGHRKTAKAFILYRNQRRQLREFAAQQTHTLIDSYLKESDWRVAENANMSYSLQGLNNHIASEITRNYWLEQIYSPEIRHAHINGDFHIHDLNLLAVYCVGWDLADLLMEGFGGAPNKVESLPPKHFRTALGQIANFFYTLQGEAAGAQAFSSVDTYLAPFIAFDGLSYTDVKQALQEWVFNLNVATRVGFQTPFTNITLDFNVPERMKDEPVILGGKRLEVTYKDFQKHVDIFNRAFLEVMIAGDAKGRVFTFPIPTYNITKNFNYNDERLLPLWQATARYGLPYFANYVNSDLSPDDARSMCCRLRLDTRNLRHRGGGLFGANPLTGSIGVVTINMPRLGHLADDMDNFLARLATLMDLACESLVQKRKTLEKFTENGLYPYAKHYLKSIKQHHGAYWHNHFSTLGLVGLDEAAHNMLGEGLDKPRGRKFSLDVLDFMRGRLIQYQNKYATPFNLEATPAEGSSYRLYRCDQEKYPDMYITQKRASEKMVYSNSSQPPIDTYDDPFALLDNQDEFQTKYTGGTVLHFYLGEQVNDPLTVKSFVRAVCENHHLPYFTLTPTFSICAQHGYLPGEQPSCPQCNGITEVYSRVVGYLRPVRQWNEGKQIEFSKRALFDKHLV